MIENEKQYRVTKAQIQRFEETLINFANDAEDKRRESPLLFEVQVSALESQLADLREELAEYEAQTAYLYDKPLLIKTNILEKTKTIEQVIQNITDKITLTNFISTSLIIGGLIFLAYFHDIGYVPELEINSVVTLLGASAITGGIIYVLISIVLILPGIFYALYSKIAGKLLVNDKNRVKGFSRLTLATSILFFNYFVLSQDNNYLWIIGKILCVIISFTIEFLICKSFYKKEINLFNFLILPVIAYLVFGLFSLVIITLIYFVVSSRTGESKNLFLYLRSPDFLVNIAYLFLIVSVVNKLVSSEADLGKNSSSFAKYLALSLIAFILITIQFGVGTVIPRNIFNMYGWGNIKNASLVVNYEGCQILRKIDIKIIDEKCSKTKDFYQIDDLQILSTIGKSYFLRYPNLAKNNDSKLIPQKNSSNLKATQSQKFVDFTFPASSVKSWARKKDQ